MKSPESDPLSAYIWSFEFSCWIPRFGDRSRLNLKTKGLCQAITLKGKPCQRVATTEANGLKLCRVHKKKRFICVDGT